MTVRARIAALAASCLALALAASAHDVDETTPGIEATVEQFARELSAVCPLASPDDRQTLDACRRALFADSSLRRSLGPFLAWGRPHARPGESLEATPLTRLAPDAWIGLYAPLFMLDGSWRLDFDESEKLYRVRLGALFRNALDPGLYPYPFWHDA